MNSGVQDCPLCRYKNLTFYYVKHDAYKRKIFTCPTCKVFIITDSAERVLQASTTQICEALSYKSAQLEPEYLLHIFATPPGSVEPLDKEPELRAKWGISQLE